MASNVHVVGATAVTVVTTAETVVATVGPFNENEADFYAQGIAFDSLVNVTIGTAGTAAVLRCRKTSVTGTLIGVAQTSTVVAGNSYSLSLMEIDPTLVQVGVVYVLTIQITAATANSTVNRAVFSAQDASAFE